MCDQFSEMLFLKCNENIIFLFKGTHNKERVPLCLKSDFTTLQIEKKTLLFRSLFQFAETLIDLNK